MIAVVFTGTRQGMTGAQQQRVRESLLDMVTMSVTFIHGGCTGADTEFHRYVVAAKQIHRPACWIICVYPSNIDNTQGSNDWIRDGANRVFPRRPPLERDKTMVMEAQSFAPRGLIATPLTMEEQERSGTWATVRYARKVKMPIRLVLPDGAIR